MLCWAWFGLDSRWFKTNLVRNPKYEPNRLTFLEEKHHEYGESYQDLISTIESNKETRPDPIMFPQFRVTHPFNKKEKKRDEITKLHNHINNSFRFQGKYISTHLPPGPPKR